MGRLRRIVTKGTVYSVSRRTTRRYFLLRPDARRRIEGSFWYCLAWAAAKHGVLVHAAVVMSTHIHYVVTDVRGVMPDFTRDLHRLFAHCVKAILGWPEEVFNKAQPAQHEPVGAEALIEGIAYVIANPAAALAVRYARDWPGAKTLPKDIGTRTIHAPHPGVYFDARTDWPDELELHLELPAALVTEMEPDEARRRIEARVRELEREALAESKRTGKPFLGARRVMSAKHTLRASSYEEFGSRNPRWSTAGDRELARQKVQELHRFNADYDAALSRWTAGDHEAVFPHGTWWMRVHHRARCRPPPDAH